MAFHFRSILRKQRDTTAAQASTGEVSATQVSADQASTLVQAAVRPRAEDELAARLERECVQLTALFRTVAEYGCDQEAGWWVQLQSFPLPERMDHTACPIILLIPREYPAAGPTTLFVPQGLGTRMGWKLSELLPRMNATESPEGWDCCSLPSIRWRGELDDLDRVFAPLYALLEAALRIGQSALVASQPSAVSLPEFRPMPLIQPTFPVDTPAGSSHGTMEMTGSASVLR